VATTARGKDGKRHLPIAPKTEVASEVDEDRPPWHWSAIGVVAIFIAWFPLVLLVNLAVKHLLGEGPASVFMMAAMVLSHAGAFALACFGGGFLVGRFGARAGRREATVSGIVAAVLAWLITAVAGARSMPVFWIFLLTSLAALGAGCARAGGAFGISRRR
jgi:tRNA-(ms[2]io[6]A)-hydroxylase